MAAMARRDLFAAGSFRSSDLVRASSARASQYSGVCRPKSIGVKRASLIGVPWAKGRPNICYTRGLRLDRPCEVSWGVTGSTRIRWFYAFLLVLTAWGGFVQVALKDDLPQRQTWDESR